MTHYFRILKPLMTVEANDCYFHMVVDVYCIDMYNTK